MGSATPLSEGEKQWQQHFTRKLEELGSGKTYCTAFLDPRQLELAESVLQSNRGLSCTVYGGYPEAERNVLYIFPNQLKGILPPVTAVLVIWPADSSGIGHRDLLGAVLSLGLRRDQVGDIVLLRDEYEGAAIMVMESKADYICSNLNRVGTVPVSCKIVDPGQLPLARENGKEIKGTVASLRVDSVLSLGFGISRSRVVRLVKGGLVKVNWRLIDSPSLQLKEGDQVSLKGRGRLQVYTVEGETRKSRIRLKLKKYS